MLLEHRDSLLPHEHIHAEMRTEPVVTTASYMATSGRMLRSVMRKTDNFVVGDTFVYELDLPFSEKIQIIDHVNRGIDGHLFRSWQVRRITAGVCGEWTGQFASAQEAARSI
jgi:hypothetical protein